MLPLLETIVPALEKAGQAILAHRVTKLVIKAGDFPITQADIDSHNLIRDALAPLGIPLVSEEAPGGAAGHKYWLLDPLDGTSDFLDGTGEWCVMLALIENNQSVLGAIHIPAQGATYTAVRGEGAYVTTSGIKTRIEIATRSLARAPRMLVSRHHYSPRMKKVAETIGATEQPLGSIGVKAMAILEDRGDIFFSDGALGEWDVAAAECILTEAGALATDLSGNKIIYGNVDRRIQNGFLAGMTGAHTRALQSLR
jgi:3'(2'), 5'-bisphosphate nucleotidase